MEKITFDVEPYTFTGTAIVVGLLLTKEFSNTELDSVGNWLQLVGLILQTYASQVSTLESKNEKEETNDIEILKKAIKNIEKKLEKIKSTD